MKKNLATLTSCRTKKVRKGDKVLVTTGNSRGLNGTVMKVQDNYVVVQGLNLKKKHVKRSEANPKGGIVEMEAPIHISNVRICDDSGKALKLKAVIEKDGERKLCYMQDNKKIIYRSMKTPK
jgi:large subunit ribosomal protein L24